MLACALRIQRTLTASLSISDGPASRVTVRVPSGPGLIAHACPKTAPRTSPPIFRRFQWAVRWRSYEEREPCVPARTSTCTHPSCVPVVFRLRSGCVPLVKLSWHNRTSVTLLQVWERFHTLYGFTCPSVSSIRALAARSNENRSPSMGNSVWPLW